MTRDDILSMAYEAGLQSAVMLHMCDGRENALLESELEELDRLVSFAALVEDAATAAANARANTSWARMCKEMVVAENEACAKVCDDWPNGRDDVCEIARAIRARSKT